MIWDCYDETCWHSWGAKGQQSKCPRCGGKRISGNPPGEDAPLKSTDDRWKYKLGLSRLNMIAKELGYDK